MKDIELMTVGQLKKLINDCPDESYVKFHIVGDDWYDIEKVLLEYVIYDNFTVPCVILEYELPD